MRFEMLYSKIHRAKITDANLNYVGSVTIDSALAKAARLLEGMKVEILNVNNGERFATYVLYGKDGSGEICLNGAAARKAQIGDVVIIVAYAGFEANELKDYVPHVVCVDENNQITTTKSEACNV